MLFSIFQFNLVLSSFAKGLNNVQVPLQLNLWHMIGCHELLASMGFDLLGVGKDEVMLRSGGVNSRRVLQCAVVGLNTLTGKCFDFPVGEGGGGALARNSLEIFRE